MTAATGHGRARFMLYGTTIAILAQVVFAAAPALAGIQTVNVGTTSWSPSATANNLRTPVFRGSNTIRIVGTNPGITLAAGFELRDGPCPSPFLTGSLKAVGSITKREVKDYAGKSSLIVSLPLTQAQALGNFCGHIYYPAGNLSRDTFTVRVFSRGLVSDVSHADADGRTPGNVAVTFTWKGVGMNPAIIDTQVTPLPGVTASAVTAVNTNTSTARLSFAYCGNFYVYPTFLFDGGAPRALTLDGYYRYQGTDYALIRVTSNCVIPSNTISPKPLSYCLEDPATAQVECPY